MSLTNSFSISFSRVRVGFGLVDYATVLRSHAGSSHTLKFRYSSSKVGLAKTRESLLSQVRLVKPLADLKREFACQNKLNISPPKMH